MSRTLALFQFTSLTMPQQTSSPATQPLFILVLLVIFSPIAIDIYLPALPQIATDLAISNALAQDTITWFIFSLGLGQLFAGPLADRYGRRPVALVGIIIYISCSIVAYLAKSIDVLLITRLCQGLGACATSVAAFACVRDSFGPEKSGRMISYLNGAICFIPALAPILGSWLTSEFGWRSNFSFMTVFGVISLTFIWFGMRETRPDDTINSKYLMSWQRYKSVLYHPTFLFHAVMCLLAMAVILAYVTSAPVYLMNQLGLNMTQFTWWFGINAVFNIAASLLAPKLMDKVGSYKALAIGLASLIIAGFAMFALQGFATDWAFMIPIIGSSIGFALVLGASAGKALAPFGDRAGTAAALLGLIQMSGAGLLVGLMQRSPLNDVDLLSVHMLLLLPCLLILCSQRGRAWHFITR